MSLQWTLVATFLYIEIALILLMLLSFIKPKTWRALFQSRFMTILATQSNLYFYAFIGILFLFFIESIREFHKYSGKLNKNEYSGSVIFYEDQMRVFRAQRNFYISGFALFCVFIIKRLIKLYDELVQLKAQSEASLRQARSASEAASKSIAKETSTSTSGGDDISSVKEKELLKERVQKLEALLKKKEIDVKAMEQQVKNTNKAFDEMAEKLSQLEASRDSRKDK